MIRKYKNTLLTFITALACLFSTSVQATTNADIEDIVNQAIAHYQEKGKDQAIADFNQGLDPFAHPKHYLIMLTLEGKILVHGVSAMVGKDVIDVRDMKQLPITRTMINSATTNRDGAWMTYHWVSATDKKLKEKHAFVKLHDDLVFVVGYFPDEEK